ncbi:MAG TPA: DUF11 domain-containing protein [Methanobacterium sp.]
MQKKHIKTVQMLIFTIVFTLAVIGAASAADNSSTNLAATNVDQATQQATQTSSNVIANNDLSNSQISNDAQTTASESKTSKDISTNVNNVDNSATDPQIWNGKAPVSRGGQIPTYNWGTIQNAINHAKSGDTIMLANGGTFSGAGNTRIIISKNLIFNVLNGGRATIDGKGTNWGFIISPGCKVTFNNINFKNMAKIGSGGAIFNRGTLTLNNCAFTNKRAFLPLFGVGGAVCNFGNLAVKNCHIYDNRGYNHGCSGTFTCKCHNKVIANVVMTKTGNGPVNVGETGIYTITLTNNGPDAAKNIRVTDPLPDGFSLGSYSAGSYDGTVWTIPSLDNGAIATLTFTRVMTTADIGTTKTNTATETQCTYNPNPVKPQTATIYTNKAVLSITKTTTKSSYNVGDSVVYNIDVLNNGPDTATNVGVKDTLANGLTYISSTLGGVYDSATRTVTWNLASLANGAHFMPSFTATVNALTQGQTITNIAFTNNSQNPIPVESTPVNIHVNNAVLSITKTANKSNYNVGDTVVYNMDVLNNGPDTATNVVLTDTLPQGLKYVSSTLNGVYDSTTRTITWTLGNLVNGAHFITSVSATVTNAAGGKHLVNTAQAKNDQIITPVKTTANIYVPSAALDLTKKVNTKTPKIGDTVIYTLIVQNHGPDAANSLKVADVVTTGGLKFVGVDSINYGTYDPNTGVWSIDNLPANAVARLVLRYKTERAGIVINNAKVTSITFDPNLYPTEASVTINVQGSSNPTTPTTTVSAKTIAMQHTGLPIVALILAVLMILGGSILPRRKN